MSNAHLPAKKFGEACYVVVQGVVDGLQEVVQLAQRRCQVPAKARQMHPPHRMKSQVSVSGRSTNEYHPAGSGVSAGKESKRVRRLE